MQNQNWRFLMFTFHRSTLIAMLCFTVLGCVCAGLANAQATSVGRLTVFNVQNPEADVDFVNAKPMPLPSNPLPPDTTKAMIEALESKQSVGTSGGASGAEGTGITSAEFLGTPAAANEVAPQDYGTNNHPFTTVRADMFSINTNKTYPYRPAGKLFFNIGTAPYICSASLIAPGLVVTAAHCVANYGASQFYSGWQFVPGYRNGAAPYHKWKAVQAWILTAYYNGSDGCAVYGVVCPDDVAILILKPSTTGAYPGTSVGWFGYWYGGGFTSNGLFQITQLGYPAGLDNAAYMERNDSYGYTNSSDSNNTIIGSNMNGGSSGGPWIENFGLPSALTGESNGSFPQQNVVVGVTSWGYTDLTIKEQGAAPFTSGNIGALVTAACAAVPGAC
jgi:V8-like Glu-specific endopeptidase